MWRWWIHKFGPALFTVGVVLTIAGIAWTRWSGLKRVAVSGAGVLVMAASIWGPTWGAGRAPGRGVAIGDGKSGKSAQ